MDQWVIAGCAVASLVGSLIIQSSKAGGRDQQINEHARRISTLEETTDEHTAQIGELRGEVKYLGKD